MGLVCILVLDLLAVFAPENDALPILAVPDVPKAELCPVEQGLQGSRRPNSGVPVGHRARTRVASLGQLNQAQLGKVVDIPDNDFRQVERIVAAVGLPFAVVEVDPY